MENQSDEFYKFYQKKSDEEILKTYVILLKKSEANNNKKQATEINNRLQPIMRITQERNLNLAKHFQLELESEQKKQANINYKKYMIDGVKTLFTGILIWAIGEGITAAFDNKLRRTCLRRK